MRRSCIRLSAATRARTCARPASPTSSRPRCWRAPDAIPAAADEDLDLVALATVADCVPLRDENRRLVREGLHALATSTKPGIRALLRVAKVDPGALDARAIGFRLAPRINAAGRLYRADAGLELVLTDDPERAAAIADELDHANAERRLTETRILFEAEAQVRELGEQPAYVLAGEGWHPGVIGIVASRIAERHHRPCVMLALDGDEGTGSGRSIPAFDLLGGLDASAEHLLRHGGHRAAAGCTIARAAVDAFRAAFVAHAAAVLTPEDLVPTERVDAVVAGDELGLALAEELEQLAPFGIANPSVSLLVPAARLVDARPMGEEGRHVRFTVEAGGHRARAVAFGMSRLPDGDVHDATFTLELNEWNGAVEPRLVLRHAQAPAPAAVALVGEPEDPVEAALAELSAPLPVAGATSRGRRRPARPARGRRRRHAGRPGGLRRAAAGGVRRCAPAPRAPRRAASEASPSPGGTRSSAIRRSSRRYAHVLALDPPASDAQAALVDERFTLAWGEAEAEYALRAHEAAYDVRPAAAAVYRALRDARPLRLPTRSRRPVRPPTRSPGPVRPPTRSPPLSPPPPRRPPPGRALRVLDELGLVRVDGPSVTLAPARRTELDASAAFRAYTTRLAEGRARLGAPRRAARAA